MLKYINTVDEERITSTSYRQPPRTGDQLSRHTVCTALPAPPVKWMLLELSMDPSMSQLPGWGEASEGRELGQKSLLLETRPSPAREVGWHQTHQGQKAHKTVSMKSISACYSQTTLKHCQPFLLATTFFFFSVN